MKRTDNRSSLGSRRRGEALPWGACLRVCAWALRIGVIRGLGDLGPRLRWALGRGCHALFTRTPGIQHLGLGPGLPPRWQGWFPVPVTPGPQLEEQWLPTIWGHGAGSACGTRRLPERSRGFQNLSGPSSRLGGVCAVFPFNPRQAPLLQAPSGLPPSHQAPRPLLPLGLGEGPPMTAAALSWGSPRVPSAVEQERVGSSSGIQSAHPHLLQTPADVAQHGEDVLSGHHPWEERHPHQHSRDPSGTPRPRPPHGQWPEPLQPHFWP